MNRGCMEGRTYIGTYPCFACMRRIRVYDWLPDCVLCVKCRSDVERQEELARDQNEG